MSSHCTYGVLFDVGQLDLISCLCTNDAKFSFLVYATLKRKVAGRLYDHQSLRNKLYNL